MNTMDLLDDAAFAPRGAESDGACETQPIAPFTLIAPLRRTTPLIFASPHSGRRYPADFLATARTGIVNLRRSEDAYVDELISGAAQHGATIIAANYARAYVDLNRDPAELDPDMYADRPEDVSGACSPRVQAGLGAIPRVTGDGQPIYRRKLPLAEAKRRLAEVHAPYHAAMRTLTEEARVEFGCAVLIDCHSMPSSARGALAPDIVLGDRFGASCHPSVTALVEATLRRRGYRVARNAPFAGGHTTQIYGRPGQRIHALQIEMSRALYMDEASLARTAGFERLTADMTRLAETLAAASLHKSLA